MHHNVSFGQCHVPLCRTLGEVFLMQDIGKSLFVCNEVDLFRDKGCVMHHSVSFGQCPLSDVPLCRTLSLEIKDV